MDKIGYILIELGCMKSFVNVDFSFRLLSEESRYSNVTFSLGDSVVVVSSFYEKVEDIICNPWKLVNISSMTEDGNIKLCYNDTSIEFADINVSKFKLL